MDRVLPLLAVILLLTVGNEGQYYPNPFYSFYNPYAYGYNPFGGFGYNPYGFGYNPFGGFGGVSGFGGLFNGFGNFTRADPWQSALTGAAAGGLLSAVLGKK